MDGEQHTRVDGEPGAIPSSDATVRFTQADLKAFAAASHNLNPIHLDPEYARRTPYASPVVFGVLAAFRCLEPLPNRKQLELRRLELEFCNPIFLDVSYEVRICALNEESAVVELREGELVLLRLRAAFDSEAPASLAASAVRNQTAECIDEIKLRDMPVDIDDTELATGPVASGVYAAGRYDSPDAPARLNPLQADLLMLCSYVVGMELPGRRALLFKLEIDFRLAGECSHRLRYEARTLRYEPDYGLLEIGVQVGAADAPIATANISVFVRKRIEAAQPGRIAALLEAPRGCLSGKVALVTGGSRGLGAAIVQALALQGCDVIVNYLASRADAEDLQARLKDAPGEVTLRQGDAADPGWCRAVGELIGERYGRLDYLICNACAPPLTLGGSAGGLARGQRFIEDNLALVTTPAEALLGLVVAGQGALVAISSSIVESESKYWPHYASLKVAVEAVVREASARHPEIAGLVLRPPGLLTDMSNTPSRSVGALSPEVVAARLADALFDHVPPGRVTVLRDFAVSETDPRRGNGDELPTSSRDRIVVSATFTANPLAAVIDFWNGELEWTFSSVLTPYHQVFQELLNPESDLSANRHGMNVILVRVEDWLREHAGEDPNTVRTFLERTLQDLIGALTAYASRAHCHSLLLVCPSPPSRWSELLRSLEQRLTSSMDGLSGLQALRVEDYHASYGVGMDIYEPVGDEFAHVPFTDAYFSFLGTLIVRRFHGLRRKPCKVIAVDGDDTLWRGVCGEVGAEGVQFDDAAKTLQQFLLAQKAQGMLLCLCSKNNEDDVWRVFEHHRNMPLARDDFVLSRIGWQPKSEGIESLSRELNLGLDSFVFMDDNAIECAEVTARCPQVLTLQVPQANEDLARLLKHVWIFDHFEATDEDGERTALYRAEMQRRLHETSSISFRGFLQSLNLVVDIEPPRREDCARLSQLTRRVNQFSLVTIRRSDKDVERLIEASANDCRGIRVRDRFGEYGLVGFVTFAAVGDCLAVETFLLSCRVLGRGVEHRTLAEVGKIALARGLSKLAVAFKETARNRPARAFLESLGAPLARHVRGDGEWLFSAERISRLEYLPEESDGQPRSPKPSSIGAAAAPAEQWQTQKWPRIANELSDPATLARRVRDRAAATVTQSLPQSPPQSSPGHAAASRLELDSVLEDLKALLAATLHLAPDSIDADAELDSYVTDSMHNVTLMVELKKRFPDLPITFVFEHRSLRAMAGQLVKERCIQPSGSPGHDSERDSERQAVAAVLPSQVSAAENDVDAEHRYEPAHLDAAPGSDIAIIGINGRYPKAASIDQFWENLKTGRCCLAETPADRWEVDAFFDTEAAADKSYSKRGGFIDDVDRFDAAFFHISPKEAVLMDPQQRLFLEVIWGLLEDAGYTRETIARETGVFVGSNANDYGLYANSLALRGVSAYRNADSYQIPNRISYFFDFHGPSVCLDTACSASGTAVDLACRSLRSGQCKFAIAGGINLFLHPSRFVQYSQMQMLSPSGECSPFGANADGTVFGEGVGALLLKPLASAERDGDNIYGVIKGCAINSGGKTNGFTVPNPHAQAALVSQAIRDARVDSRTITYVEAHGTGTPLGDPIEVRGLTVAFEQARSGEPARAQSCALGAVKANIGHLEAGAAIPGIIKILLQMKHALLVPSLNAAETNPTIPFASSPFRVQRALEPWRRPVLEENGRLVTYPLRAGISSFGAGGSNAHIILEEYSATQPQSHANRAQLVVLSANDADALRARAVQLCESLRQSDGTLRLADVAYTLRVGREEMHERLAVVVSSVEELAEKLTRWAALPAGDKRTDVSSDGIHVGNARAGKPAAERLLGDDDGARFINHLTAKLRLDKLAQLWVAGLDIDWVLLDRAEQAAAPRAGAPRRVSLPSYPFAGDRFWLPGSPNLALAEERDRKARQAHPLLDGVDAGSSLQRGIVFHKTFDAHTPLVSDHVVREQALLPAVAVLEMVFAALQQVDDGANFTLADIVWSRPLEIAGRDRQIRLAIEPDDTGELRYELRGDEPAEAVVYSSGRIRRVDGGSGSGEQRFDIDALRQRCPRRLDQEAIYRRFRDMAIDYGPYFQSMTQVVSNDDEALSSVRLPTRVAHELERYILHPSILDAALQTTLLLDEGDGATALPFAAAAVEILQPLAGACAYAYVRRIAPQRFQVSVLDETGLLCIVIRELDLRVLNDPLERFFYTPRWKPCPLAQLTAASGGADASDVLIVYSPQSSALADALAVHHPAAAVYRINMSGKSARLDERAWEIDPSAPEALAGSLASVGELDRIYFLGVTGAELADVGDLAALALSQQIGVLSLFRMLKGLAANGFARQPVDLFVVTDDVFRLDVESRTRPQGASLLGLATVAAKEFPQLRVRSVDISLQPEPTTPAEWRSLVAPILGEPARNGGEVVIRHGQRYVRTLEPTRIPAPEQTPFRQAGVYLILGGAGGLGFELSLYLAETFAARLIWLGRSPLDADKQQKITRLEAAGGQVLYLQADACDLASMRRAVQQAKDKFGAIQGGVHCAIVLRDRTLANMDEVEFNAALEPKVTGAASLYKVLEQEPLDFMVLFSSANSFMRAMGQANYVAGCCFKDALGRHFNETAPFATSIINWGYWGDTGIVSSRDYQRRITAEGHRSIRSEEGLEAVRRLLGASVEQAAAIKADDKPLLDMGVDLQARAELYPQRMPPLLGGLLDEDRSPDIEAACVSRFKHAFEQLETLGRCLTVAAFRELGLLQRAGERYELERLKTELGITEPYFHLFEALVDLLSAAGFLRRSGSELTTTPKLDELELMSGWDELARRSTQLAESYPEVADRIPLLEACLRALPAVLTGAKSHMEIMFPGGSLHLVEAVYTGNEITDYFNRRLARLIADYVRKRVAEDAHAQIRILELGAGTGASSRHVLEALRPMADQVRYLYTDVSKSFLRHGEDAFGAEYPFVQFQLFDMEAAPEQQALQRGCIDLVFGTNCIHATRNITATLNRVKRLIKANGVLLLNEFTERLDYNTLTFGLTGGWWLFDDPAFRIKQAPLLGPGQWRQVLQSNGFRAVRFLDGAANPDACAGQCLIACESDGRVVYEAVLEPDERPELAVVFDAAPARAVASIAAADSSGDDVQPLGDDMSPALSSQDGQPDIGLREQTQAYVKRVFADVTDLEASRIDSDSTFEVYGIDSLISLQISQRFAGDLGSLPATLLFENPTVTALVEYFLANHRESLAQQFGVQQRASASTPAATSQLAVVPSAEVVSETPLAVDRASIAIEPVSTAESATPSITDSVATGTASVAPDEDIAIIGVAGRYPMAESVEQFWDNLKSARNCITEVPPERWSALAHYDPNADGNHRSHSRWGGFINDADCFDALFFNISPKEAKSLDPQERLFLETVWHAVENAAHTRKTLEMLQDRDGKGIGVFVGCMYQQYPFVAEDRDTSALLSNASYWSIANRVSYFFNLHGPSLAIDSACSSSLTAIHLACESIKRGECVMAVAGGVNLNLHPSKYLRLQQYGMLASTPQSKSLGDGDGLVPGEGVGAVLLKPLSLAIADGDIVRAVIKSTVVNHDGKTGGFRVPNPNAQASLIARALEKAKVDPRSVGYVEVAANGSALGDPIEIAGLSKAFNQHTDARGYCAIGAVKSNVGHLEAASGVAQLTKVLLQLEQETLVPSLNAEPLNPRLSLTDTPFYVQQELSHWQRFQSTGQGRVTDCPRRAAISSFGAGGANAHVVVEESPKPRPGARTTSLDGPELIVLSAKSEDALKTMARNLAAFLHDRAATQDNTVRDHDPVAAIGRDLLALTAEVLDVEAGDIELEQDLSSYGFDAMHYTLLAGRLREHYGIEFASNALLLTPNLRGVAEYLASSHRQAVIEHYSHTDDERALQIASSQSTPALVDIAYSLQIGREAMPERLALIVSSLDELVAGLEAFVQGSSQIDNAYTGRVSPRAPQAQIIDTDAEGQAYLRSLLDARKLDKLAQLWALGVDPDWSQLHARCDPLSTFKRVCLPTYPFERRRFWITEPDEKATVAEAPPRQVAVAGATPGRSEPAAPSGTLRSDDADAVQGWIRHELRSLLAALLEVDENEIDFDEELQAYGVDSIGLTTLAQQIGERYAIDITPSVFFAHPSIAAWAEGLWEAEPAALSRYHRRIQPGPAPAMMPAVEALARNHAPVLAEVTARADRLAPADDGAVAIIGIAGRMPGSSSLEHFWEHLIEGRELITEVPTERWSLRRHRDASAVSADMSCVKWGSFLDDVDKFDSLFFGISPREAQLMDPRQRLLLETVWATIENAGYSADDLAGSNTGLFVGVGNNDYSDVLLDTRTELTAHASTGLMVNSILTSRISYLLDFHGPSEILDTACSSSTVALHKAVRAIRHGECDVAIAGGVNVLLDPNGFVMLDKAGVLSNDGKVRLFSEGATGYVRGEGVGAVLLKPLGRALAERDHIHAIIRGSALNHDGKSFSLTSPNPIAQAAVMFEAYRDAGIDPRTVTYLEAQGTGSPIADPVEIQAMKRAFARLYEQWDVSCDTPTCGIGYLKPNIGHLECASGIAALLKVLWAFKEGQIPGTRNIDETEAGRHLRHSPFYLVRKNQTWKPGLDRAGQAVPRRAGLHSYGFGGVNAHVVLEQWNQQQA